MQSRQDKTHSSDSAVHTEESTQKADRSAASAKQLPAWTHTWGDRPPAELITPLAGLQAEGAVNQPGDIYEQEADRIASQVISLKAGAPTVSTPPDSQKISSLPSRGSYIQRNCACGGTTEDGEECEECGNKQMATIQRRSKSDVGVSLISTHQAGLDVQDSQHSGVLAADKGTPSIQISHLPPMIQRAALEEDATAPSTTSEESAPTSNTAVAESAPTPDVSTAEPAPADNGPGETSSPGLIVEDSAEQLAPGQMKKSDFLAQLRPAVCTTAEEALKGTIWSAAGCPWIDHWFAYYSNRDSQQIERALRRYAPETTRVSSASDYIPIICERVRRGIGEWSTTGEVPGLPEGIDLPDMGIMGLAGSVASGIASVGSSIASGVESVASGIASVGSRIASGVGSMLSGIGSLFSKGREGGAREASNPQAIQGQLGGGRSLDGAVRSQMEPAFGADFSHVRIHTDATAAGLSESLNARAFTLGRDVAFGPGEYRPGTLVGDALIAHELAHVVQQGSVNTSSEPLQKGGAEYNSLEEDADVSAVGAVISMRSGSKGILANIAQNAMPAMRAGLRLQKCAGANAQRQTTPTTRRGIPRGVQIPNWSSRVQAAQNISDAAQKAREMAMLVGEALGGTFEVRIGGNSNSTQQVDSSDYQPLPIINFDINLNTRESKPNTPGGSTHSLRDNYGYSFSARYVIIGPKALDSTPDHTRRAVEHELYHIEHHQGRGRSSESNIDELETYTNDFYNYFHLLYIDGGSTVTRYQGQSWDTLINYYERVTDVTARQRTVGRLVEYYQHPPVPTAQAQNIREVFARWLRRQQSRHPSNPLVQDLDNSLHLLGSASSGP